MRKRILAALVCLCMVMALLPSTALAAGPWVWIGNQSLSNATPYYHNDPSGGQGRVDNDPTGYNAYFDTSTATLTLNGLDITVADLMAMKIEGTVSLVLNGRSTVTSTSTAATSATPTAGIYYTSGTLTISGSGSLIVSGGTTSQDRGFSCGVYADSGSITVLSGTLEGKGGAASGADGTSYGVYAKNGSISVSSGTLEGQGGAASGTGGTSYGVSTTLTIQYASTYIMVFGGTLKGTGGTGGSVSCGVGGSGAIAVPGGTLEGRSGTGGDASYGVYTVQEDISVSGGTLLGASGAATGSSGESYGVYADGVGIMFSRGTLIAQCGAAVSEGALNKAVGTSNLPFYWRTSSSGNYSTDALPGAAYTGNYLELTTAAPPTPTITLTPTGGASFPAGGATGNAQFRIVSSDGSLTTSNYDSAKLDGAPLDLGRQGARGADGMVTAGSIIITINQTKLNTLSVGDHALEVSLTGANIGGEQVVRGVITVTAQGGDTGAAVPQTGDGTPIWPMVGLALLCGLGLAIGRRKREE